VEVTIMSDDRELVERLAAIDATPRASWVAELRADLDAAWETGDAGYYLDSLRTTTLTLVDHEPTPPEPSSRRRWLILIAAAAAVVAAIALVATRDDNATPVHQPSPTVTVPPTVPPRALPASIPPGERLLPGTYFVDDVEGIPTPRIFFTIGAGWTDMPSDQATDSFGGPSFSHPGAVFSDACHWEDGYHPGPLTTVDGLVAALNEQGGWADVTAPSDISIDGYAGKAFQRTVPADISDCDNIGWAPRYVNEEDRGKVQPAFRSWQIEEGELTPDTGGNMAGFGYEPGMIETLWVLDIDGTVVVVNSRPVPEASAADRAVFAAVLDSIRIDRA
jgi:hypothetical protein